MNRVECIIVGAGSVGVNAAMCLDAYGVSVALLETEPDILSGAAQTTFVNHSDGYEYYDANDRRTGELCVEGALTKALLYHVSSLTTNVCSETNRIRFFVAERAVTSGLVNEKNFQENILHQTQYYSRRFHTYSRRLEDSGFGRSQTLGLAPLDAINFLTLKEFDDVSGVSCGIAGCGFGVNMARYYATVRAGLERSSVQCHFNANLVEIVKTSSVSYRVVTDRGEWETNNILLCNSHHIPKTASLIKGSELLCKFPGTYYLNCITFLKLPATQNRERIDRASKINFTLIGEYGGMYACILPPTYSSDGMAAIYYPHMPGSHRASHTILPGELSTPPLEWDALLQQGPSNDDRFVRETYTQACRLYPFLQGYATVSHSVCRTVFNVGVDGNKDGLLRSWRHLSEDNHSLTSDGMVSGWTAPKWTNAELTALIAVDYLLQATNRPRLPRDTSLGCGPNLDVIEISRRFNLRALEPALEDIQRYVTTWGLPNRIASN